MTEIPLDPTRERKAAHRASGIYKFELGDLASFAGVPAPLLTAASDWNLVRSGGCIFSSTSRAGGHVAGRRAAHLAAQSRIRTGAKLLQML